MISSLTCGSFQHMFLKLQTIWSFSSYLLLFIHRLFCSVVIKKMLCMIDICRSLLFFCQEGVYCVNIPLLLKRMCSPQLLRQCWYMSNRLVCIFLFRYSIFLVIFLFLFENQNKRSHMPRWDLFFLINHCWPLNSIGVRVLTFLTVKSLCVTLQLALHIHILDSVSHGLCSIIIRIYWKKFS